MDYLNHVKLSLQIAQFADWSTRDSWLGDAASFMVKFMHFNLTELIQ